MNDKLDHLINILKDMQSAVLAYSGGVDSTLLLKALQLSGIRILAVTAVSEITPKSDLFDAKRIVKELGIEHRIIHTDELSREEFVTNTPDRCFFCKDALFKKLTDLALYEKYMVVLDGSTTDDTRDYRPGRKAAMKYNIRSPLIEAELSKIEVREFSKQLGLSTWDKPSSPCLSTRFPYGRRITKEALKRVESAEDFIRSLGFCEIRVRDHGNIAMIEVEEDKIGLLFIPEKRKSISEKLISLGYDFISIDLNGYKSGSLNRGLKGSHIL
jgi:uncharacterized protein